MAATTRLVAPAQRGMASGIVNAGGSFGQFVFAPLAQGITAAAGWVAALQSLAAFTLIALPAAWVLRTRAKQAHTPNAASPATPVTHDSAGAALRRAFALPSYRWLCAGFFVCGFHVAFIATHLPGVVASCQLPPEVGAWSLGVIGLFNILGSLTMGWAIGYQGGRWRMKSLLSLVYAARGLAVMAFVFAPKTSTTMLIFAAVIGFTYLSTVPPTAGLVARFFGPSQMAMLFGVVMLSHQVGGFLGAYLGGKTFEWTGSYDWMWWADIVLAIGAALAHLPIDEKRPALAAQLA
jgi:predicted MFS family arabinose efflux permease